MRRKKKEAGNNGWLDWNDGDVDVKHYPTFFFWNVLRMDFSTAIRAENVEEQNFSRGYHAPRCWFIDAWFRCERCKEEFCWTKEEQKLWFEEYKLRVDSVPHVCPLCRREIYEHVNLRRHYDAGIAAALEKSASVEVKKEMLDIINHLKRYLKDKMPESIQKNLRTLTNQLTNG
jgi:allantoicase